MLRSNRKGKGGTPPHKYQAHSEHGSSESKKKGLFGLVKSISRRATGRSPGGSSVSSSKYSNNNSPRSTSSVKVVSSTAEAVALMSSQLSTPSTYSSPEARNSSPAKVSVAILHDNDNHYYDPTARRPWPTRSSSRSGNSSRSRNNDNRTLLKVHSNIDDGDHCDMDDDNSSKDGGRTIPASNYSHKQHHHHHDCFHRSASMPTPVKLYSKNQHSFGPVDLDDSLVSLEQPSFSRDGGPVDLDVTISPDGSFDGASNDTSNNNANVMPTMTVTDIDDPLLPMDTLLVEQHPEPRANDVSLLHDTSGDAFSPAANNTINPSVKSSPWTCNHHGNAFTSPAPLGAAVAATVTTWASPDDVTNRSGDAFLPFATHHPSPVAHVEATATNHHSTSWNQDATITPSPATTNNQKALDFDDATATNHQTTSWNQDAIITPSQATTNSQKALDFDDATATNHHTTSWNQGATVTPSPASNNQEALDFDDDTDSMVSPSMVSPMTLLPGLLTGDYDGTSSSTQDSSTDSSTALLPRIPSSTSSSGVRVTSLTSSSSSKSNPPLLSAIPSSTHTTSSGVPLLASPDTTTTSLASVSPFAADDGEKDHAVDDGELKRLLVKHLSEGDVLSPTKKFDWNSTPLQRKRVMEKHLAETPDSDNGSELLLNMLLTDGDNSSSSSGEDDELVTSQRKLISVDKQLSDDVAPAEETPKTDFNDSNLVTPTPLQERLTEKQWSSFSDGQDLLAKTPPPKVTFLDESLRQVLTEKHRVSFLEDNPAFIEEQNKENTAPVETALGESLRNQLMEKHRSSVSAACRGEDKTKETSPIRTPLGGSLQSQLMEKHSSSVSTATSFGDTALIRATVSLRDRLLARHAASFSGKKTPDVSPKPVWTPDVSPKKPACKSSVDERCESNGNQTAKSTADDNSTSDDSFSALVKTAAIRAATAERFTGSPSKIRQRLVQKYLEQGQQGTPPSSSSSNGSGSEHSTPVKKPNSCAVAQSPTLREKRQLVREQQDYLQYMLTRARSKSNSNSNSNSDSWTSSSPESSKSAGSPYSASVRSMSTVHESPFEDEPSSQWVDFERTSKPSPEGSENIYHTSFSRCEESTDIETPIEYENIVTPVKAMPEPRALDYSIQNPPAETPPAECARNLPSEEVDPPGDSCCKDPNFKPDASGYYEAPSAESDSSSEGEIVDATQGAFVTLASPRYGPEGRFSSSSEEDSDSEASSPIAVSPMLGGDNVKSTTGVLLTDAFSTFEARRSATSRIEGSPDEGIDQLESASDSSDNIEPQDLFPETTGSTTGVLLTDAFSTFEARRSATSGKIEGSPDEGIDRLESTSDSSANIEPQDLFPETTGSTTDGDSFYGSRSSLATDSREGETKFESFYTLAEPSAEDRREELQSLFPSSEKDCNTDVNSMIGAKYQFETVSSCQYNIRSTMPDVPDAILKILRSGGPVPGSGGNERNSCSPPKGLNVTPTTVCSSTISEDANAFPTVSTKATTPPDQDASSVSRTYVLEPEDTSRSGCFRDSCERSEDSYCRIGLLDDSFKTNAKKQFAASLRADADPKNIPGDLLKPPKCESRCSTVSFVTLRSSNSTGSAANEGLGSPGKSTKSPSKRGMCVSFHLQDGQDESAINDSLMSNDGSFCETPVLDRTWLDRFGNNISAIEDRSADQHSLHVAEVDDSGSFLVGLLAGDSGDEADIVTGRLPANENGEQQSDEVSRIRQASQFWGSPNQNTDSSGSNRKASRGSARSSNVKFSNGQAVDPPAGLPALMDRVDSVLDTTEEPEEVDNTMDDFPSRSKLQPKKIPLLDSRLRQDSPKKSEQKARRQQVIVETVDSDSDDESLVTCEEPVARPSSSTYTEQSTVAVAQEEARARGVAFGASARTHVTPDALLFKAAKELRDEKLSQLFGIVSDTMSTMPNFFGSSENSFWPLSQTKPRNSPGEAIECTLVEQPAANPSRPRLRSHPWDDTFRRWT
ncbi:expressed unknown protein [Seminavis robusta]|uniref:Uncharacterized protein n=1 Tax=Seminavis robusta TaxID=568900 RepID=A0A9N8E9D6_9STRA|nr:expressed unknown protein [Seminavis robusta]|eukprot:Sro638_g179640.1 n/a (1968) ;mRNA; f:37944-43963